MNYSFEVNVDDNKYYEFNKYTMLYPHGKKEKFLRTKLLLPAVFLLSWVINLISGKDWEYLTISILVYAPLRALETVLLEIPNSRAISSKVAKISSPL